jgi:3-hydroxy-3-methylglutaryl CoA synthase
MEMPQSNLKPMLLKPTQPVGIIGYGAYVPRYRLPAKEVARIWTDGAGGLPIKEKAVPGLDEDVATMSIEAARNAMLRAGIHAEEALAVFEGSYSYVTDTPDFWRREYQRYPEHGQRFTGEPAYFKHILEAGQALMEGTHTTAKDYKWAVFHQPNAKFPQRVAAQLGFTKEQIAPGLLVQVIGNTYAGAALIGLTGILDIAEPGDKIMMVSFGSGAGSDAFAIRVTDAIRERRDRAPKTQEYIARRTEIDYGTYVRYRGKLAMK